MTTEDHEAKFYSLVVWGWFSSERVDYTFIIITVNSTFTMGPYNVPINQRKCPLPVGSYNKLTRLGVNLPPTSTTLFFSFDLL